MDLSSVNKGNLKSHLKAIFIISLRIAHGLPIYDGTGRFIRFGKILEWEGGLTHKKIRWNYNGTSVIKSIEMALDYYFGSFRKKFLKKFNLPTKSNELLGTLNAIFYNISKEFEDSGLYNVKVKNEIWNESIIWTTVEKPPKQKKEKRAKKCKETSI
jgi:hypothetical protein